MKSPFPGMDPYVERNWRDVHASLVVYSRDQLVAKLPPNLVARVEERVVFEVEEEAERRLFFPDVGVVERSGSMAVEPAAVGLADDTEDEPLIVSVLADPMTETFIEIHDADRRKLITVIEFIGVTNKSSGDGTTDYRRKQRELRSGGVNLVEIDLVRGGKRGVLWPMRFFPKRARTQYLTCVSRAAKPGFLEVYPITLQRRLPRIRIPLRKKDADVTLDLQPVFEHAYLMGSYGSSIDYREPAQPPLEGADAEWTDALLKKTGKR